MYRSTRVVAAVLSAFAIAAPAAVASPVDGVRTSSLAGTTAAPRQDLRNPDNRGVESTQASQPSLAGPPTWPVHPQRFVQVNEPVAASDSGTSALVYVLPGLAVALMVSAGAAYAIRVSAHGRRTRARVSV